MCASIITDIFMCVRARVCVFMCICVYLWGGSYRILDEGFYEYITIEKVDIHLCNHKLYSNWSASTISHLYYSCDSNGIFHIGCVMLWYFFINRLINVGEIVLENDSVSRINWLPFYQFSNSSCVTDFSFLRWFS